MTRKPPEPFQSGKTMTSIRLRTLLRRAILLGVISFLSYPLLTGASWLTHSITSRGSKSPWVSDSLSDTGMVVFAAGLTVTTALIIVYIGLRDWNNPYARSAARARRTVIVGVIAVPFTFALLAITINVVNALLHS